MAKSHGYYLQHAKEVCLVGKKGSDPPGIRRCVGSDVIYSERRGQSQKPEEIYQLIEELVPNGACLQTCCIMLAVVLVTLTEYKVLVAYFGGCLPVNFQEYFILLP